MGRRHPPIYKPNGRLLALYADRSMACLVPLRVHRVHKLTNRIVLDWKHRVVNVFNLGGSLNAKRLGQFNQHGKDCYVMMTTENIFELDLARFATMASDKLGGNRVTEIMDIICIERGFLRPLPQPEENTPFVLLGKIQ